MGLEQLLENYTPEVKEKVIYTRSFLLEKYTILTEEFDLPSRLIVFRIAPGMKGIVFSMILSKNGVKLGIFRGSELNDPQNLLHGTGKVHKYIEIESPAQLFSPTVLELLDNAVDHSRARQKG